jgi:4'-phosphopantetheinyl transferase
MAIVLHENIEPSGAIGLWDIEETEEWFLAHLQLAPAEQKQFKRLRGGRRLEWLAARQLVHRMSGRLVRGPFVKDEYGKPHLTDSPYHISISHSHGLAAAIAAPRLVGIDIQRLTPKLRRLAARFMRKEELGTMGQEPTDLQRIHIYWGAKEALYKAYGRRSLDFRDHIALDPFEYQNEGGTARGRICKETQAPLEFEINYRRFNEHMLVYVQQI